MVQDLRFLLWGENAASRDSLLAHLILLHTVTIFVPILLFVIVIVSLNFLLSARSGMKLEGPIAHRHDRTIYHGLCW